MADLTTNRIPKATGATVVGDSAITDDGTRITFMIPVVQKPAASVTPAANGDLVFEATSNTTLTIKYRGTDGTIRTATLTLA
jgi:hypothetical protein